jgi:HEAT repeat protein
MPVWVRLHYQVNWYLWALGPGTAEAGDDLVAYLCDAWQHYTWGRGEAVTFMRLGPRAVSALDRALKQALADRDRPPATLEEFQERLKNMAWVAQPLLRRALEHVRGARDAARVAPADLLQANLRLWMAHILEQAIGMSAPHRRTIIPTYLGMIGPPARSSVPTLIAALDCADFRDPAVYALGAIGKDAAPAVPHLLPFLDSDDESLRIGAFAALEAIGVRDEAVRARLRPSLTSGNLHERVRAAHLLVAFGEPVEQILPLLFKWALDPHGEGLPPGEPYLRAALLTSIASLGAAAVSDLTVGLQSPNPKMRQLAVEALGKIGPAARDSVPRLIELLDDPDLWDTATEALGRIGPEAHAAVPKLLEALAARRVPPNRGDYDPDDYEPSRYEYLLRLHALGGIGAEARDAAPAVLRLADFDDPAIRHPAVLTLARIDPANRSLIPLLRRWLREWERKPATEQEYEYQGRSGPRRSYAEFVDAVWELGPGAEQLVPDLKRIVTTAPLLGCKARCYAACALARFAAHRQEAERYLEKVVKSGFPGSMTHINLACALLQRIKGVQSE